MDIDRRNSHLTAVERMDDGNLRVKRYDVEASNE